VYFFLKNNFPLFKSSYFQGVPFTVVPHPSGPGGIQGFSRHQQAGGAAEAESIQLRTQIDIKV